MILKPNSVNICPLPAGIAGAENHRKRPGLSLWLQDFVVCFCPWDELTVLCALSDARPLVCLTGALSGSFTRQLRRAAPWQISWPSRGLQSPSLTRSESSDCKGRHLPGVFLLGCSTSAWRPPCTCFLLLGFSVPFDWLTILERIFFVQITGMIPVS